MCKDHVLEHHSSPGHSHELQVDRAAAALEAKAGRGSRQEACTVKKKGKTAAGIVKQKKPLAGRKTAATKRKSPQERNYTEEKTPVT